MDGVVPSYTGSTGVATVPEFFIVLDFLGDKVRQGPGRDRPWPCCQGHTGGRQLMGWCLAVADAAGLQGASHCGSCGPHRKFQQQLPVSVLLELGESRSS